MPLAAIFVRLSVLLFLTILRKCSWIVVNIGLGTPFSSLDVTACDAQNILNAPLNFSFTSPVFATCASASMIALTNAISASRSNLNHLFAKSIVSPVQVRLILRCYRVLMSLKVILSIRSWIKLPFYSRKNNRYRYWSFSRNNLSLQGENRLLLLEHGYFDMTTQNNHCNNRFHRLRNHPIRLVRC